MNLLRRFGAPAFVLLAASCATAPPPSLEDDAIGETRNVHSFGDIFVAGQPSPDDFVLVKERGVRTVLTVRPPEELDFDERAVVEGLGMTYVEVPWSGADQLTDEVFDRGRELLENAERPIFFH